ncbi:aminoacetone oxidase family FAD-binding enzyme [Solidesulfovibrio sp.]|uniref:NAD(P)/FAD-dependent oxidoreductase n=1 Tax=Solidesulfovibrio sp. TaxID=2910990 RepID=UPI00263A2963|nr:aminoacetone oxidase family FAD-binding enzyme [Solidesulfovibrio sp.]
MRVDVAILGAGASGLTCAAACAARGRATLVIDHGERPARKVLASGGGRSNITNTDVGPADYVCANPHFVKSALARFGPGDLLESLAAAGVATDVEDGGKVFCRDGAKSAVRFLVGRAEAAGAKTLLGTAVLDVRREGGGFTVATSAGPVDCAALVLALGGRSWPALGASGLGHDLARRLGLGVTALRPGLAPLLAGPQDLELCRELAGVSLPVAVSGPCDLAGDLLFTHKGVSGPAVLDASLFWREGRTLFLDFLPGIDVEAALAESGRQEVRNILARRLPRRLAAALCARLGVAGPAAGLAAAARRQLAATLRAFPFAPAGTAGWAKAEVTLGGVDTAAVSSKTMEASAVPGLYVVGELLDVTGRLGGFNLHWAFASGLAAGQAA